MKHIGVFAFLVVTLFAVSSNAANSTWGILGASDVLVVRQNVLKVGQSLKFVNANVTYPAKGQTNKRRISFIRANDNDRKGKGGFASILKGGVGQTNVTVGFKSQLSYGLNFTLDIYVKPY